MQKALPCLLIAVILNNGALLANPQATTSESAPFTYENHNQIDYGPLKLGKIAGKVHDEQGVVIPNAQLGIFTDSEHRLVAMAASDADGRFQFEKVPPGRYRLVVKSDGFCPANVPLVVVPSGRSTHSLDLHMKVGGIDVCSFGVVIKKSGAKSSSN
jgi:protocatechuate 3,4-dioxygenase beta subunit